MSHVCPVLAKKQMDVPTSQNICNNCLGFSGTRTLGRLLQLPFRPRTLWGTLLLSTDAATSAPNISRPKWPLPNHSAVRKGCFEVFEPPVFGQLSNQHLPVFGNFTPPVMAVAVEAGPLGRFPSPQGKASAEYPPKMDIKVAWTSEVLRTFASTGSKEPTCWPMSEHVAIENDNKLVVNKDVRFNP